MRASGEATVTAQPDRALIDIGVVTQAPNAQAAAAQNVRQLDAVLKELRQAIGAAGTLKTVSYSLQPDYRYPREGGRPTITGYTASNVVQVTLDQIDLTGKVIDAATRSGANTVQRLQFTLKDEQTVQAQALRLAAQKARASAEAIAAGLGVKIVRVLSAEEGGGIVAPVRDMQMMRMPEAAASAPTPVEPGTLTVRATVAATFEVAP